MPTTNTDRAYTTQRTSGAYASRVPERAWTTFGRRCTLATADRRIAKEYAQMRRRCGAGCWDTNYRILGPDGSEVDQPGR